MRELKHGGMGTLYVVRQKSTGKQRALKLMLPTLVSDPTLRRRFEQEAKVGSLIESDHIVGWWARASTARAACPGSRWSS